MTIEEVGMITDIGGSIAVILTLGFLAFQVNRARVGSLPAKRSRHDQ